jgi:hypothetical protein
MDTASLFRVARGRKAQLAGLMAGGLGLVAALAAAAAPPAPHTSVTNIPGELMSVSAVSPSDAWATGTAGMLHWTGRAWARVTVPDAKNGSLNSVSADSASDAWAVGQTCSGPACAEVLDLALHWNGRSWARARVPSPGTAPVVDNLASVSADTPSDAWAVGNFGTLGAIGKALALHWNGMAWAQVAVPNSGKVDLLAVTAKSPSDAWAVGDNLNSQDVVILHWNGMAWTQAATPALKGDLRAVTELSPRDAWAVGGCCGANFNQSLVLHWNGMSWTRQSSPSPGGTAVPDFSRLTGVSALSATNAWAAGISGHDTAQFLVGKPLVLHWNGMSWTQATAPFFTTASGLDSVQALSRTNAWATGGIFQRDAPGNTLILHWNGMAWTRS